MARLGCRLGIIAATLSGVALALHLGGPDGYTVPVADLLGEPTSQLLFRGLGSLLHSSWQGLASSGPNSVWDFHHVLFCASIALNWTLIGAGIDVVHSRHARSQPPEDLGLDEPDRLLTTDPLREAFDDLERTVRERDNEPRANARPCVA